MVCMVSVLKLRVYIVDFTGAVVEWCVAGLLHRIIREFPGGEAVLPKAAYLRT